MMLLESGETLPPTLQLGRRGASCDIERSGSDVGGRTSAFSVDPKNLRVLEDVGEGGFATVKRCELTVPGMGKEIVAAKQLKADCFERDREFIDFIAETLLMSRLNHPNIVRFKGLCEGKLGGDEGVEGSPISVVGEYMNMGTLTDQLDAQMRGSSLAYTKASGMRWMLQVARALEYLHGLNATVIHRDLKPENILFTRDELTQEVVVKVADFGLSAVVRRQKKARSVDIRREGLIPAEGGNSFTSRGSGELWGMQHKHAVRLLSPDVRSRVVGSNLMRSVTMISNVFEPCDGTPKSSRRTPIDVYHDLSGRTGSLMYMAPEVLSYKKYNEKVDVYSFGIILYEVMARSKLIYMLMTNAKPGQEVASQVRRYSESVQNGYRPPIPLQWPLGIRLLIGDCWQHCPADRPSMKEVVGRLEAALKTEVQKEQREEEAREGACVCCSIM
ncbi:hypothetical protein BSKO_07427 [Bryopsis sp. KO-2023]|nr:hypothetical protein BSKO_07427 [Bryopsis sp. KO-2023]